MKKLFAMLLTFTLSISLSNVNVRAENISPSNLRGTIEDNSSLTVNVMEELFWEELVKKSEEEMIISEEDKYVSWLIDELDEIKPYVKYDIGGIDLKKVYGNRLMKKFQKVVDLYNDYFKLQVGMKSKIEDDILQVEFTSSNIKCIENRPISSIGQLAHVNLEGALGVIYFESSKNFGSGKYGILASFGNEHIIVNVNGVAYLDEKGDIISSFYGCEKEIDTSKSHMLHIASKGIDLGWIHPNNLRKAYCSK